MTNEEVKNIKEKLENFSEDRKETCYGFSLTDEFP